MKNNLIKIKHKLNNNSYFTYILKDNLKHGRCEFYINDKLKTYYTYKDGIMHGESASYRSNGDIEKYMLYNNGSLMFFEEYDEENELIKIVNFDI
jgi:antitoxin component YwqK of YwqJK toxin-antitoxin module